MSSGDSVCAGGRDVYIMSINSSHSQRVAIVFQLKTIFRILIATEQLF